VLHVALIPAPRGETFTLRFAAAIDTAVRCVAKVSLATKFVAGDTGAFGP